VRHFNLDNAQFDMFFVICLDIMLQIISCYCDVLVGFVVVLIKALYLLICIFCEMYFKLVWVVVKLLHGRAENTVFQRG
jgi:hypothetical protein